MHAIRDDEEARIRSANLCVHRALFNKDYECAITLASAGEGQLPESTKEYLFRLLRRLKPTEDFNLFISWMKHPLGPEGAKIEELEVVLIISRAIQKYVAVYEEAVPRFIQFSDWAVEQGHMPRSIIQQASA